MLTVLTYGTIFKSIQLYYIMRQIEKQMNFAVSNKGNWSGSNTSVSYHPTEHLSEVRLHGHLIAWYDHSKGTLGISSCGWTTNTTKSRLNALLYELFYGVSVFQKNWEWFVSDSKGRVVDFYDGQIVSNVGVSHIKTHPVPA